MWHGLDIKSGNLVSACLERKALTHGGEPAVPRYSPFQHPWHAAKPDSLVEDSAIVGEEDLLGRAGAKTDVAHLFISTSSIAAGQHG